MNVFKKIISFLIFVFFIVSANGSVNIIPTPNKVECNGQEFVFSKKTHITISNPTLKSSAELFVNRLSKKIRPSIKNNGKNKIDLILDKTVKPESYILTITNKKITIKGDKTGVFYGLQSLWQMIKFSEVSKGKVKLQGCIIEDSPRYAWRGVMLDESRHFFGKKKVMELIDMMAIQKLNKFHWHLTDANGWRIEIKSLPKLTTVGGIGDLTDPNAKAQFYTQAEIKEIVKYAKDRFIEVIPEIDMPGHATAANRAYPEFCGGGSKKYPDYTFNPGYEGTYKHLTTILREVASLFPSKYIHFGGDEVHFGNASWKTDKHVKALMEKEGLKNIKEVEHYFANRIVDIISKLGKTAMGWDEIVDAGTDNTRSVIMWWRHDRLNYLTNSLNKGYKVVLCPRRPLYFDFVQHDSHKVGRRWGGFCPLADVYNYPNHKEIDNDNNQIMGLQANIWSEKIKSHKRFDYMTYPRLSALACAGWTAPKSKNYESFIITLEKFMNYYKELGIYAFDPFNLNEEPLK